MAELPDRMKLESKIGVVLSRLGSRQRRELEQILGNPPNVGNVPDSWWTDKQAELAAVLLLLLGDVYYRSAKQHGLDREAARQMSQQWAAKQATDLASDFTKNSRDILRTDARDWTGDQMTKKAIRETTLKMLGPKRMTRVAVTETSRGQHEGADEAVSRLDTEVIRIWRHSRFRPKGHAGAAVDPCPICTPNLNKPSDEWNGHEPGISHPMCDCFTEYQDAEGKVLYYA